MPTNSLPRPLKTTSQVGFSNNPRMDHADVTNARDLFGDPYSDFTGDVDFGDNEFGDINDSTLAAFSAISGDIDGDIDGDPYGDAGRNKRRALRVGAGLAAGGLALAIRQKIKRNREAVARSRAMMNAQINRSSQRNQRALVSNAGKINRRRKMPFFDVIGAKMNSSPIDPSEGFPADMFKYNLDRQNSDTPFLQETAIGTFNGTLWTVTAPGVVTTRYYTTLIVQMGINTLNAAPGTVFIVTATLPTINGTQVVSSNPWIFTISKGFDVRFSIFPWILVANKPVLVLGAYNTLTPITVQVSGLPAQSAVTMVVPGSLHKWTVAMRNALMA